MQLATRFASRSPVLRSERPLSDDQIRTVAPSIFAEAPHESRSERYSYIPTAALLSELRREGLWRGGRCREVDPAHAGGVHGGGSWFQEGRAGTAEAIGEVRLGGRPLCLSALS